ncbi:hypothetical protein V8F33_003123, partial [Rhypophila sp. PSN 637]
GPTVVASHSGGGTVNSTPASSEPDSASWSREESTLSSGDEHEHIPPTRRPPLRGPPPTFPFPRRDGRPFSGAWLPPSGTSRHSLPQTRLFRQPDPVANHTSESGYSDNGRTALSADEELQQLWDKLDDQWRNVRRLRGDVTEKREVVRGMGRKKDEIDNAFMQIIRPHLTSSQRVAGIPTDVMAKRFVDMQRIRDDYYSNQSVLETMEARLDSEEDELKALENQLYRLLYDKVGPRHKGPLSGQFELNEGQDSRSDGEGEDDDDDEEDDDAASKYSRYSLLGISAERQDDIHPLYRSLLDAIADREDAKEHLDELRNHRMEITRSLEMKIHRLRNNQGNLMSEEELTRLKISLTKVPADSNTFRAQYGVPIGSADLQFLQAFEHQETRVKAELERASAKVERLRDLCIQKGVMRKNAPYSEEYTIFRGTNRALAQQDGNMTIDDEYATSRVYDLTHPKFPVLLSNPSHVLDLMSPMEALERAMKLPKDSPTTVYRRQECMKELGISNLMLKFESKPDYINQWLIHRLRTCPMEAELMLCVAEERLERSKITSNLRKWQEEVLYFWRRDEAANLSPNDFHGPMTPRDELD